MRLLERELQLGALHEYAADARRGDGRLVLVSGEAGIGKSSLVEAFVDGLTDARLAWTSCDGAFTPSALGPLQDVADQWGGAVRVACAEGVPREARFAALLSMLREHGDDGGLSVLVVEDLHFADEATLDLVRHVARRLRGVRALVVATYRDDGLAENRALRETLGDASTQRSTRRIALPPLSPAAVTELSRGIGPRAGRRARADRRQPVLRQRGAARRAASELPASARDAVLARAARLSPAGRDVLDAAALVGERVEPDLLHAVTGADARPPSTSPSPPGLLVADGAVLRFRHEIARRAVEQEVGPHRPPRCTAASSPSCGRSGVATTPDWPTTPRARSTRRRPSATPAAPATGRAELASRREAVTQYRRALRFVAHRPAARPGRPPRRAGPRAGHARPVGACRRGPGGVGRALARRGRAAARGRRLRRLGRAPTGAVPWTRGRRPRPVAPWRSSSPSAPRASWPGRCRAPGRAVHGLREHRTSASRTPAAPGSWPRPWARRRRQRRAQHSGVRRATTGRPLVPAGCRESLDLALARRAARARPAAPTRTCMGMLADAMRYPEAERYYREGAAYCEEHDLAHVRPLPRRGPGHRPHAHRAWARSRTSRRAAARAIAPPPSTGSLSWCRSGSAGATRAARGVASASTRPRRRPTASASRRTRHGAGRPRRGPVAGR